MEGNECTKNSFKDNSRISHPFLSKTSTYLPGCNQLSVPNSCFRLHDHNNSQNEKAGRSKDCTPITKLHFPSVSCAEARRVSPPYIQPQSVKRICANRTLPFDKHVSHPRFPAAAGLDVQDRHIPSVLSFENSRAAQALSKTHLRRGVIGNDLPSVRFEYSSKNLLNVNELGGSNAARHVEHENPSISRRHFDSKSKSKNTARSCQSHSTNIKKSRMAGQFQEIHTSSPKEHNLSRHSVENLGESEKSSCGKKFINQKSNKSSSGAKEYNYKRITKNNRDSELRQFRDTTRSTQSSVLNEVTKLTTRTIGEGIPVTTRSVRGIDVVDGELSISNSNTLSSSETFFDNGCFRPGLGSAAKQSSDLRKLDFRRERIALQSKRNAGHTACPPVQDSRTPPQFHSHTMRQQDRSSTSPKRRRHKVVTPLGNNSPNSESTRSTSNTFQNTLHTRKIQQSCRPFITPSHTSRMALTGTRRRHSICEMGISNDRLICLQDSTRNQQLRVIGSDGSPSSISRRVQYSMELPPRVGISTTVSHTQSPDSSKSVEGSVSNSRASMGEGILARRPQSTSNRGSVNLEEPSETSHRHDNGTTPSECREPCSGGMEMWGWSEAVETWNSEQISLLKNSWRKSTLKTYEVAWRRWCSWATTKGININSPSGPQLAQFLSDLYLIHNLSYNTILLHKSVVSTLCNADISGQLSSNVIVKHILKSIAFKNPKNTKPPIWDVGKLINYLSKYTVDTNNMFQTSRHAAIVLLLCSGRRIHDLTLLRIDPRHYIKTNESVVFWPEFGSKTDNNTYRQSGWKLLVNPNNNNLNPPYWIERTILLMKERREASKSSSLFITVRGQPKPASRTVIAGWIKTVFQEAGITATPGSVRSAVASKSWLENNPLDDILARGNWQSAKTFQQFYRREVINNVNSENVTQLFNPVS